MAGFPQSQEPLGRFVGKTDWQLAEDLHYVSDLIDLVVVPAGTVSDFASIPRAFWRILPPWDTHRRAAIVHDHLYTTQIHPKHIADKVFLEAMKAIGVPAWKAHSMYQAVKWFGFAAWNNHAKENREAAERGRLANAISEISKPSIVADDRFKNS